MLKIVLLSASALCLAACGSIGLDCDPDERIVCDVPDGIERCWCEPKTDNQGEIKPAFEPEPQPWKK